MAYARMHRFEIGAPVQFDVEYDAVTSLECLLGAIGADVVNGLQLLARKRRLPVADVEAAVSGELNNPLVYLGVVGEHGHPGIEKVKIRVFVSSPAHETDLRSLWEEMLDKSPLIRTFRNAVVLELSFQAIT